jgi:hypothetical protein
MIKECKNTERNRAREMWKKGRKLEDEREDGRTGEEKEGVRAVTV